MLKRIICSVSAPGFSREEILELEIPDDQIGSNIEGLCEDAVMDWAARWVSIGWDEYEDPTED